MSKENKSVITCDLDGKLETYSESAQELFGYTPKEVIGKVRVSDFSDGQVVLGHVVGCWMKPLKMAPGKVIRFSSTKMDTKFPVILKLLLQKEKMASILATAV